MAIQNQPDLARKRRISLLRAGGFTLIELMAVAAIIGVLAGILVGATHYVNMRNNILRAKAEMSALSTSIEMFRSDYGTYPTSSLVKFDTNSFGVIYAQVTNSALLYSQLVATGGRRYFTPTSKQWTNSFLYTTNGLTYLTSNISFLVDPWGKPYNYYRTYPPTTSQVNQVTFDLISAGPDRRFNTADDIVNWKTLQ